jgi:porphobilinogen synthase
MRRLREHPVMRDMIRETRLSTDNLIMPLFVVEGLSGKEEIRSMPGQYRFSIEELVKACGRIREKGIKSVMLFGIPQKKDEQASGAWASNGIIQKSIREIKKNVADLFVIADVCLCEYMSHGHCGIVNEETILNDESLDLINRTALSQVEAGADMVAPSNMADGTIQSIRTHLDDCKLTRIPIMSYSAKYASGFYGPFRDAAESAPQFGDRRSYQMDPANSREAMREIELDINEGADIVMVKPALSYMDVIFEARQRFDHPLAAYNVSGEYAMVKAAAANGWIDEKRITMEILTSIRRAGANIILTYHALDAADWLK